MDYTSEFITQEVIRTIVNLLLKLQLIVTKFVINLFIVDISQSGFVD